jgi:hypothetical protein
MSIHRAVRLNLALVLGIGLFGVVTDEPYWRSVGHDPSLYDYLFWFGLALNGPSGVTADYLSWLVTSNNSKYGLEFVVQYVLWLLLLWPQWKGYDVVVVWCIGHPRRKAVLYAAIAGIVVIGGVAAYEGWMYGHRPRELAFIDRYFWFVRIASVALSGLVILAYAQFRTRSRAL